MLSIFAIGGFTDEFFNNFSVATNCPVCLSIFAWKWIRIEFWKKDRALYLSVKDDSDNEGFRSFVALHRIPFEKS